ncbi:MAG: ribonuclease HI family protein [Dehalococcoidia bacterium]
MAKGIIESKGMINTYVTVYTDGACSGNPGPGAIGVIVLDENNQEVAAYKGCIGETTNNRAEYEALIKGLELAAGICRKKVVCFSDSQLLVKQLNKTWRIKNKELLKLNIEVNERVKLFEEVVFQHISRNNQYITKADRLTKDALAGK